MSKGPLISRRTVLGAALAAAAIPAVDRLKPSSWRSHIRGSICGANAGHAHRIREKTAWAPSKTREMGVVIVGGGIAGLSAGWALHRHGYHDFCILELDNKPGGNSQSGHNSVSAYPWGAHYVPVPGKDAALVRILFEELGVITHYSGEKPVFREEYLCAAPHERLYQFGSWQDGILPQLGASEQDLQEYRRWDELVQKFSMHRGNDGKPAFTIPVDLSSADPNIRALDSLSFAQYLSEHNFNSAYLRWYLNYCCLDDYGAPLEHVSAWAGIHYFASRNSWVEGIEDHQLLTWPAGNGWIVERLTEKLGSRVRTGNLVVEIDDRQEQPEITVLDLRTNHVERIRTRAVFYCAPRFTAAYVLRSFQASKPDYLNQFKYQPWMVANITLRDLPADSDKGLAWDNVFFHSKSLGYVNATHQHIGRRTPSTVVTYYLPLAGDDPAKARRDAQQKSWEEWRDLVVSDLETVHPDVAARILNIDVWLWGHGMICPSPGFVWGKNRQDALRPTAGVYFAHSDMSGISIFEEAQYRGVLAAEAFLRAEKFSFEAMLV